MKFKLIEPPSRAFQGRSAQRRARARLPEEMVGRHPFPGPGLGIRILGAVNESSLDVLRRADAIYLEEIRERSLRRDLAGVCRAAAGSHRGREGRLPDL